jgi:hypothetical protein
MLFILSRCFPRCEARPLLQSELIFTEDGTMRLRKALIAISLTACLYSTLLGMAIPRHLEASDRVKQGRHSLISRPSILPHPKIPRSEPRLSEGSKPLSLVTRVRPAAER